MNGIEQYIPWLLQFLAKMSDRVNSSPAVERETADLQPSGQVSYYIIKAEVRFRVAIVREESISLRI